MKRLSVVCMVAIIPFFLISNVLAQQITRVSFNGWTQNRSSSQRIAFMLVIQTNQNANPPDLIKTITITAPDGSNLTIDPVKDWLSPATEPYYWKAFYAGDFLKGKIESGIYKVKVTPLIGTSITESDTINAVFLPLATITYPLNNATNIPSMPTFKWSKVEGASFYRVMLWDITTSSPIYWDFSAGMNKHTNLTSFAVPRGVLKPNYRYQLRIQARSGNQDTDARSDSDWVFFSTGSW